MFHYVTKRSDDDGQREIALHTRFTLGSKPVEKSYESSFAALLTYRLSLLQAQCIVSSISQVTLTDSNLARSVNVVKCPTAWPSG